MIIEQVGILTHRESEEHEEHCINMLVLYGIETYTTITVEEYLAEMHPEDDSYWHLFATTEEAIQDFLRWMDEEIEHGIMPDGKNEHDGFAPPAEFDRLEDYD